MTIKKYGGNDFGCTLEELKKLSPLAETIGNVEFHGSARKVSAILTMASVGGELIAEIERLTVAEQRAGTMEALLPSAELALKALNVAVSVYDVELADNARRGLRALIAALKPAAENSADQNKADFIRLNSAPHCPECGHPDCNGQCYGDDMMGSED